MASTTTAGIDPRRYDEMDWFAVQVWVGREHASAEQLRLRGYDVFLPSYQRHRQWSDRVKKIECALFPGYVFSRANANAAAKIVASPGVLRIVGDGAGPVAVPMREVDAIRRIVEARLSAEPCEYLCAGQRVCVERGPLRGTKGVVLMLRNRRRLVVSIPLLQRSVAVEMDADWLSVPWTPLPDSSVR